MKDSSLKLLQERYFLENEKEWDDIAKRVSSGIYPESYEAIKNLEFIPSSPTLMNANTNGKRKGTLSSCFTMDVKDSIGNIFDSLKEGAQVTKMGGGIGYDFSILRSSIENVSTIDRKSSGPLPFINIFNSMLDGIQQGGVRRGAGMAMLDIYHPDILCFIDAKVDYKNNVFNRFNFSVRIPDSFYEKLEKTPNEPHMVKKVVSKEELPLKDNDGNVVTVKQLWDKIIRCAWASAEPGIFNSDIATRQCTVTNIDKKVLSNPCITGDSLIKCEDGEFKIKDLVGKNKYVYTFNESKNIFELKETEKIWKTRENAEIYELKLKNGNVLKVTSDHKIYTKRGWVETLMLNLDDLILTQYQYVKIKSIRKLEQKEDVYDITVKDNHNFIANNMVIHNCQEYVGIPFSSCNLASLNLTKFIKNKTFDFNKFEKYIELAVIFLNNVIDKNEFPIPQIEKVTKKVRPIGLGMMGLAHVLYKLGIPYNSEKAHKLTEKILSYMTIKSMMFSIELAKKDGPYEVFDLGTFVSANERFFTINYPEDWGINKDKILEDLKNYGVRNSCFTSIAPTGSISYIAETSSGIEPIFSLAYTRKIEKINREYEHVYITDPIFETFLDNNYKELKDKILEEVTNNEGSCQKSKYLTDEHKAIFVTARDLTPDEHLNMLAVVSNKTSLSVSKTINLPKSTTEEEISKVYLNAHKKGIIGVTVYREGSREGILITKDSKKILKTSAPKRPKELDCDVHHFTIDRRRYYVVIGLMDNDPYEVFTGINHGENAEIYIPKEVENGKTYKEGRGNYILKTILKDEPKEYGLTLGHSDESVDALTRIISTSLRHGTDISYIVHQIEKTKGPMISFTKALSRTLKKYIPDGTVVSGDNCPKCQSKLIRMEGCIKCNNCGYSRCS